MKGFDAAVPVGDQAAVIKRAGYDFVGRYYSYSPKKNLTLPEAQALAAAGVAVVTVFEALGNLYSSFDGANGRRDAMQAVQLAQAIGQPPGSAIYFAVDFDASPDEIASGITSYFVAVNAGLAGHYRVGVYGSGMVCASLRVEGFAELFWLAGAMGWRGSRDFTGAHLRQGLPAHPFPTITADPDVGDGDFGQWSLAAPVPVPAGVTVADAVATVRVLQQQLAALGLYRWAIDGQCGPGTAAAAMAAWHAAGA